MQTEIDRIYNDAKAIVSILETANEVSLANSAADHLRKTLLMACASHFERNFCDLLLEYVAGKSRADAKLANIIKTKVIDRNYHQWFSWTSKNANAFYAMFGPDFKQTLETRHSQDEEFKKSVLAFLEIGNERNKLVHQNYATFQLNKTIDEIYALYNAAIFFFETVKISLTDE